MIINFLVQVRKLSVILILFFSIQHVNAQTVLHITLEQAIDSCLKTNPDYRISAIELEGFAANSCFKTNFYQENLIFEKDAKSQWGDVPLVASSSDFVNARRELKQIEHQLLRSYLIMQVKQAWYGYIYRINELKIYQAQVKLMSLCAGVVQDNLDSTLKQPVQMARMRAYFEQTLINVNNARLNVEDATSDFQRISGLHAPYIPADSTSVIASIEKPDGAIASAKLFTSYLYALKAKNEASYRLNDETENNKNARGRGTRKLNRRDGLMEWPLDLDAPFYKKQAQSYIEGREKEIQQLIFEKEKIKNAALLSDVRNELHRSFTQLGYYRSTGLEYARLLEQSALQELEKGSPDYKLFLDNLVEAINLRINQVETIHRYNMASTTLEWYLQ